MDGYKLTKYILSNHSAELSTSYPAFNAVTTYRTKVPAPTGYTTDWYMPSIGEWRKILGENGIGNKSMTAVDACTDSNMYRFSSVEGQTGDAATTFRDEIIDNVNKYLKAAGVAEGSDALFAYPEWYWSSTKASTEDRYMVYFYTQYLTYNIYGTHKSHDTSNIRIRCILAF